MNKTSRDFLALALDNISDANSIKKLVESTEEFFGTYKIGLEQFVRFGPDIINLIKKKDRQIFLDLKLHDIPNTVYKAVESASKLGVDILTIHTQGGSEMMKAAKNASLNTDKPLKIIGVTVLTSIDESVLNNELRVKFNPAEQAKHLANLAVKSNLDGIVCSAADLPVVKDVIPNNFEVVTPGIRLAGGNVHDQKRVATPDSAIKNGATLLVIGRAVTSSDNPKNAAQKIIEAF